MFTGIVEELGSVVAIGAHSDAGVAIGAHSDAGVAIGAHSDAARLSVRGPVVVKDARPGDSIAVNGVCLTVVTIDEDVCTADLMRETLDRTCLGALREGDVVNLERAATLGTRLGGHLVQGHVDGVGRIAARQPAEHWEVVRIALPAGLSRYLVEKGSITVDGVSLTVVAVDDAQFAVSLIPATLALTTLGSKAVGSPVNLEVDVIAKYVEKLVGGRS